MKKNLLAFFGLFLFSFNAYGGEKVINENVTFKPFKCKQKNNQYKKHNARKHTHQEALAIDTLMEMVTGIKHEKDITYLAKRPKYGIDNLIGFNTNCIK